MTLPTVGMSSRNLTNQFTLHNPAHGVLMDTIVRSGAPRTSECDCAMLAQTFERRL